MLKIDKSIGFWFDNNTNDKMTSLDDYAYQLYVNTITEKYDNYSMASQYDMYYYYNNKVNIDLKIGGVNFSIEHYNKAKILIERKQKLKRIEICSKLEIK